MSEGKNCPNYFDIIAFLADHPDKADFKGNIDELGDCTECRDCGVCSLWITCLFIDDLAPRLGLPSKEIGINDLDDYMNKIALALVQRKNNVRQANLSAGKRVYPVKVFENMIPLRAENYNNIYFRNNLQKAYDAFHQEDYETAVLLFRMLLSDYNKRDELNLYAAISYFFAEDYENAAKFMEYCRERSYTYDSRKGAAFFDMCVKKMNLE